MRKKVNFSISVGIICFMTLTGFKTISQETTKKVIVISKDLKTENCN